MVELVETTAGFRDEYYGMAQACEEFVGDGDPPNKLVTGGTLGLGVELWGDGPTRFAKAQWQRPYINKAKCDEKTLRWVNRQLQPKILVATQSKILKSVLDVDGKLVGVTPLIIVTPKSPELLLKVQALLLAPPVSLWSYRRSFGSGLSIEAIKLSAKQMLTVPLPANQNLWSEAAAKLEKLTPHTTEGNCEHCVLVDEVAQIMTEAYKQADSVYEWWAGRLQ